MPKLVYIYGDDHKCLETLISSMRSNGYSLEYTSLPDEPAAGAIRAGYRADLQACRQHHAL